MSVHAGRQAEQEVLPTPAPCSPTPRALRAFRWRLQITPAMLTEKWARARLGSARIDITRSGT